MQSTTLLLMFLVFLYFAHGSTSFVKTSTNRSVKLMSFDLTGRIVNGTKATLRQFPHQVSLMRSYSKKHFCGGNIISHKLILTAGHCMYINDMVIQPWMILVVGGIIKLNESIVTKQERSVEKYIIHSNFNITTLYNDIAILKLLKPFQFTPEIYNIILSGNFPVSETFCQVSGWGYLAENSHQVSNNLMYVNLPIRSIKECRKLFENVTDLSAGMFCAGFLEGGKDSCQGDSGGGMVCNGILTGLVSGGIGCAQPRLPGIYIDISYYMDWILNNTNWILNDTDVIMIEKSNFTCNYSTHKMPTIIVVMISSFFVLLSMIFYS